MFGERIQGYRYKNAIIGFGGTPTLWWMRFLKKGFYHCLVALGEGNKWILIDPLLHYTDLLVITEGNMEKFLNNKGYKTLRWSITEPKRGFSLMPYTCVETSKRFIGISKSYILTPHQLYKYITKMRKKSLT